jgi:hypothetical protein
MAYTQRTPIGVPDADQITQTLASLQPDSALQQYAAMHKNDPYIMSLANAESNRRKALRAAAAAGQPPAPKVVDAAIAGMAPAPVAQAALPENQGIAQLPAPNVQHMADGGIAGYDEDGGMAQGGMLDFAQRSEPVLRMAGGGHIPRYQGNTMDGSVVRSNPMFSIPGFQAVQPRDQFTQQGAPENTPFFQRVMESLSGSNKERQLAMIEQKIAQGTATPEEIAAYQTAKAKAGDKPQMGAPKDVVNPDEILMAADKAKKAGAAPADKPAPKPTATDAAQPALPTGIASIKDAKKMSDELFGTKDLEGKIEQQRLQERQDIQNQKEDRLAKLDAFNKGQGQAYSGYEKLLKSEELQDTTDKEKAGLTALFKGFLGMAAGESPNAAVNIAKGALSGLEEYSGAMKEFKKAARERNKAMADIENARRSEARGDFKDQQTFEDKAAERLAASDRHATDAVVQITGKKGEGAVSIAREMIQQSGANARTNAQIAAGKGPGQQEHLFKTLGEGDVKAGLGYYAGIMGPEAKGEQAMLAKYSGPQGVIALQMLEASGPEGKAQAQIIRQALKQNASSMLKPVNVANALP